MFKTLHKSLGLALLAFAATAQAQVELPYTIDFTSNQEGWTALDANADGKTWITGESWQDLNGGTHGNAVYSAFGNGKTFNDYYVSPQVTLESGKSYKVTVASATSDANFADLSVELGTDAADAATFQKVSDLTVGYGMTRSGWSYTWTGATPEEHVFAVTKGGTYNIGLHVTSTSSYSYASIALFSYSIEETTDEAEVTVNTGEEGGGEVEPTVLDVPYSTSFVTEEGTTGWTAFDANESDNTWKWSEWAFMDYVTYKSYVGVAFAADYNWDYDNPLGDADDYYVSPGLNLKKGVTYTVTSEAAKYQRCTNANLTLALGTNAADASTFTDLGAIATSDEESIVNGKTADMKTVTVEEDGVYYLAFHMKSENNTGNDAYGAAFSFAIEAAAAETAAPGDVTEATLEVYGNYIALDWVNPTVDAEGNKLPEDAELKVYIYENGELATGLDENPVVGKPGDFSSASFEASAENATYKLVVEYNGKTSTGIELYNEPTTYDLQPTAIAPDTAEVQEYLGTLTLTFDQELYFNELATNNVTFTNAATGASINGYAMASEKTMTIYASDMDAIVAAEDGSVATWTVSIPEGLVVDETCATKNFTGGHANAALTLTYKVGKLAETLTPSSVVPSTEETQEYLSTITVNFDEEIFAGPEGIANDVITLTNNAEGKEIAAYAYASGTSLVIYPSESIDAAEDGTASYWTVNIPAGVVYDAAATEYGYLAGKTNGALTYNYTVQKEAETPQVVEADPADGSTVEKIQTITLTFTNETAAGTGMTEEKATIYKGEELITTFGIERTEFGTDFNQMVVTLSEAITADGTYTISFPAGFFSFGENGDVNSKAFTLTYTVDSTLGINAISIDNLEGKSVYTIGGQKVQKANQKGIYIVDGKKVVLK